MRSMVAVVVVEPQRKRICSSFGYCTAWCNTNTDQNMAVVIDGDSEKEEDHRGGCQDDDKRLVD